MNINKVLTKTDYNTVVSGADVTITYKDSLFLYHAFIALRAQLNELNNHIVDMTSNEEPIATCNRVAQIVQSMDFLLMPIAEEVVLPKEGIDIYNYVSHQEEPTGRINLKKKQRYDMDADTVLATVPSPIH